MAGPAAESSPAPSAEVRTARPLASLPVAFVENRGQTDSRVRYYAQGAGFGFYLTPDDIRLAFTPESSAGRTDASAGHALSLQFVDANRHAVLAGERTAGSVNYLRGSDPARWQTDLGRFGAITYRELWPGVNLRVEEHAGTLKYEFHVAPGADPAAIRLAYRGASSLTLDASGALLIGTRHRRAARCAAGVVSDDRRRPHAGRERLPARVRRGADALRLPPRLSIAAIASS